MMIIAGYYYNRDLLLIVYLVASSTPTSTLKRLCLFSVSENELFFFSCSYSSECGSHLSSHIFAYSYYFFLVRQLFGLCIPIAVIFFSFNILSFTLPKQLSCRSSLVCDVNRG